MAKCFVCKKNEATHGNICDRCDPATNARSQAGALLANDIQYAARLVHKIVNNLGNLREYTRLPEEERQAITNAVLSVESLLGEAVDALLARDYLKGHPEPETKLKPTWQKQVYGSGGGGDTRANRPNPRPSPPPAKPKTTDAAHPWREQGF